MRDQLLSVLVTGAGAPGIRGTLYALRHNPDGVRLRVVGTDIKPDVVGRYFVDSFYQVPDPATVGYAERLVEICKREGVDLIIPQTTREAVILSRFAGEFKRDGILVMVSDARSVELANNKAKLLDAFSHLQLPHPSYRLARTQEELVQFATELGYPSRPVVVKPPISNGMRGFRILRDDGWDVQRFLNEKPNGIEISLEDLLKILGSGNNWPELLVTEYLPGPEYSVDAFIGERTAVALPRLRKAIRSGITFEAALDYRDDVAQFTLRAGRYLGLRYTFGFQFKLDEAGVPKVLECNPRVQGTMVASVFGGINVIWLGVKELLGDPPSQLREIPQPAMFYRYWGGIGIRGDEWDEI